LQNIICLVFVLNSIVQMFADNKKKQIKIPAGTYLIYIICLLTWWNFYTTIDN